MIPGISGMIGGISQGFPYIKTLDLSATTGGTISDIPAGGKLMRIRGLTRSSRVSAPPFANSAMGFRFNGDAAANYQIQRLQGYNAIKFVEFSDNSLQAPVIFSPGLNSPANSAAAFEIVIPYYSAIDFQKSGIMRIEQRTDTVATGLQVEIQSFVWKSTAPIISVTAVDLNIVNYANGSFFEVEII